MKFIVTRTSSSHDTKPCEEAFESNFIYTDIRDVDDPEKLPRCIFPPRSRAVDYWYGNGRDHTVIDGHIVRKIDQVKWCVELADLDALIAFVKKYGEIVIIPPEDVTPGIEIYDGYRE